jgi:S-adenosylmethionine:tRNA ribosyltransferase-isomerase
MKTSDFDYNLPEKLIAQTPLDRRDSSRLLLLSRKTGNILHKNFSDIADVLSPGDALILNDSKVLPARLLGEKIPTGGAIEFLLLQQKNHDTWEILTRPGRKAVPGARFSFGGGKLGGEIAEVLEGGNRLARFKWEGDFFNVLEDVGEIPLPHYITAALHDNTRYQTVYAKDAGSAAAPTAGLHFTPELLEKLQNCGVGIGFVTLHVGLGTFRPVDGEVIAEHQMHSEQFNVPLKTAELINRTKKAGRRVIAVGTTSCRTLESACSGHGEIKACSGSTELFIYPGANNRFMVIDGLLTNFHLPKSTLIMLVSAFAGYENTMNAYREAIAGEYRFYSFGDAMLIL